MQCTSLLTNESTKEENGFGSSSCDCQLSVSQGTCMLWIRDAALQSCPRKVLSSAAGEVVETILFLAVWLSGPIKWSGFGKEGKSKPCKETGNFCCCFWNYCHQLLKVLVFVLDCLGLFLTTIISTSGSLTFWFSLIVFSQCYCRRRHVALLFTYHRKITKEAQQLPSCLCLEDCVVPVTQTILN